MINRHDEREMHDLVFRTCVAAVQEGFPHLTMGAIIDPPHHWFDAALARQFVIHIMVARFHYPKRRIVELQERSRDAVNRALNTIDWRLDTPEFEAHYRKISERAGTLFGEALAEAA